MFQNQTCHLLPGRDPMTAKPIVFESAERPTCMGKKQLLVLTLIDPKPLTRQSILEMLAQALPDYMTVAISSCEELLDLEGRPPGCAHLVVIYTRSAQLTDPWVQSALELVRLHLTTASVVLLSDRDDVDDVGKSLTSGVRGYIPTSVEAEVAFAALRLVNAGGTFIPARALWPSPPKADTGSERNPQGLPNEISLTPRELSVFDLLREGKPNKLIAAELKIQESTVKVQVRSILRKLGVGNRTHAAFVADCILGPQSSTPLALPRQPSNGLIDPTPKRKSDDNAERYRQLGVCRLTESAIG
jgi:DNA-binding NarL/FixJ family response regulator